MALITSLEAANRLARTIASDVALYNQEKVKEGIQNDNLFEILEEELEEGRSLFLSRVSPELPGSDNLYDRAIVDVLIRHSGDIPSRIW